MQVDIYNKSVYFILKVKIVNIRLCYKTDDRGFGERT